MDPLSRTPRTDLHVEASAPRPTPRAGVNFREALARSASSLVRGAQSAMTQLPGGAVLAAAVRGASGPAPGGAYASPGLPSAPAGLAGAYASPGLTSAPAGLAGPVNPLTPPAPLAAGAASATSSKAGEAAGAPAEGPGAAGASPEGGGGSVEAMLQTSADMNLYYLQLQEAMAAENRVYSAQSNVLKARHDTVKNAIGNIR
ncbi:MAG TPA: hypothetical protein VFS00_32990 [Polyangiaceae bacterium]|nr:hypothetical protein [Polyangiaceae bacterium]